MSQSEHRVIESVNNAGVPFEIIEIDPAFSDTTAFCAKYGYPAEHTCNTIIVTSRKAPWKSAACIILANGRLDVNKRVKNLLGVQKISFASSDQMLALTGMEVGGVTPFSLPSDLPLYVDAQVMNAEWVILGGGSRRIKIKIKPEVLLKLGAQVITDLAAAQSS
ncbi:MAG TPA: YbaK/EbsC family protein [Pyrinomonadaceae bacterium]|nr:YbaK/EbsC family protein [Pyrinomonadaceae bacterium]